MTDPKTTNGASGAKPTKEVAIRDLVDAVIDLHSADKSEPLNLRIKRAADGRISFSANTHMGS